MNSLKTFDNNFLFNKVKFLAGVDEAGLGMINLITTDCVEL
jgi:hypothetical protein